MSNLFRTTTREYVSKAKPMTDTEKLARLLSMLNERCDTVDGPDGEPQANEAMSILSEYEGWLNGWVK